MNASAMMQSAIMPIVENRRHQSDVKAAQKERSNSMMAQAISNVWQNIAGVIDTYNIAQQRKRESDYLTEALAR